MPPRHFWWLVAEAKPKQALSKEDRGAILEALRGNPKGPIW
jgi:hypothetical protein